MHSISHNERNYNCVQDKAYYGLPAQANQQILKLLLRDYKSFFEAVKAFSRKPSSFTGRPHMPKYVAAGSFKTAILTNQICRIKDQFHKISRQLADHARDNRVDVVVMGHAA